MAAVSRAAIERGREIERREAELLVAMRSHGSSGECDAWEPGKPHIETCQRFAALMVALRKLDEQRAFLLAEHL